MKVYIDKKKVLTRLSGIFKGILSNKKEIEELHRLCEKYPEHIPKKYKNIYLSAYA